MPQLCQGRVVWVWLNDPQGRNPKEHPVILVDSAADIQKNEILVGVVASHTAAMKECRLDTWVEIPFHTGKRCPSAFAKPTVAVCEWQVKIVKSDISDDKIGGVVSPRHVWEIRQTLKRIEAQAEAAKRAGDTS